MKLSEGFLQAQTLPQVWERGQQLWTQGRVLQVLRQGDLFTGEVLGTERYRQTLDLRGEQAIATCTCPFAGKGWCKHRIAVGLAILAGKMGELPATGRTIPDADRFWRAEFQTADAALRDRFLRQLFRKSPRLRQAFVRFRPQAEVELNLVDIGKLAAETKASSRSSDEFRAFLGEQEKRVAAFLQVGDCLNALHILLALYEGIWETGWGEKRHEFLQPIFNTLLKGLQRELLSTVRARQLTDLLFRRWSQRERKHDGTKKKWQYQLTDFEALLMAWTGDEVIGHFVQTKLSAYGVELPALQEHLRQLEGEI